MKKNIIIIGSVILVLLGMGFLYFWYFAVGAIMIRANVEGSKIFIGGQKIGENQVEVVKRRGVYEVKIEKNKYSTEISNIKIYGWQKKEVTYKLVKLPEASVVKTGVSTMDLDNTSSNFLLGSNNGREFIKADLDKNKDILLSRVDFGQENRIRWSPNNYLAYIWRADESSGLVDLKRYDLLSQTFVGGKKGVMDLSWKNDGKEVVFVYKPGDGEFSLVRSTPLGENMERLYFHLDREGIVNPKVYWTKDSGDVVLQDKNIFVYNIYAHELKKISNLGSVKWARLSSNGKYIAYADKAGTYIIDLSGRKVRQWKLSLDLAEWLPDGKEIIGISDGEFVIMDAQNQKMSEYGYNGTRIKDVAALGMTRNNSSVYFLRKNNEIWRLKLQSKVIDRTKEE